MSPRQPLLVLVLVLVLVRLALPLVRLALPLVRLALPLARCLGWRARQSLLWRAAMWLIRT